MDVLFVATYGVLEGPSPSVAGYRAGRGYPCTFGSLDPSLFPLR